MLLLPKCGIFPQAKYSPVPLAGLLGQQGKGCRAGAEFVPWDRLRVAEVRHKDVLKIPMQLPKPHER